MSKHIKKSLSVFLTAIILIGIFAVMPISASAANTADSLVDIARRELGSSNYSKYYGGHKNAWCADFVTWCAQQAGVGSITNSSSCYYMYQGMKNNGCQEVSSPQKGDIVFFYCNRCSSTAGKWCHVGIMEDSTYSIEGNNWSDGTSKVQRGKSYNHNGDLGYSHGDKNGCITRKYLRPKYDANQTYNYVDVGTDFYAYIINTSRWKHLTNDDNNVSMRSETGNANQVWKFERQNDGSYKIINCKDNRVLDVQNGESKNGTNVQVYDSNDTNAQRWYILGESASYYLKSKCGECVLDVTGGGSDDGTNIQVWGKNDTSSQKFQIWKLNKAGSTYCSVAAGTNYVPTTIWWNNASDTIEYDVKIWKGTVWQGEAYKILWAQKDTSCVVNLPEGYYEAYVDCRNKYSLTMSENIVKFNVSKGEPVDVGENIYAGLLVYKNWVNVANVNKNAELLSDTSQNPNKIWNFIKQSDGSYIIINCGNGKALDVYCAGNDNGTNVQLCDLNYSDAQKWYIYGRWTGEFYLKPKCSDKVLDISGGNNKSGDNVQLWELNYSDAQKFAIYGIDKAEKTSVKFTNNESTEHPFLKWEQAKGATEYQVKIYDNSDKLVVDYTTKNLTFIPALSKGNYKATVISKNYYSNSISDYISFTIENGSLIGDADSDGILSVNDATQLQMYLSFINGYDGKPIINENNEYEFAIADFNKDNIITIDDVTAIQMAIAEIS